MLQVVDRFLSLSLFSYLPDRHLQFRPPELGREDESVRGDEQERGERHQAADPGVLPSRFEIIHFLGALNKDGEGD